MVLVELAVVVAAVQMVHLMMLDLVVPVLLE